MPLHGSHKFGYRTFFNKEQPKLSEKKKNWPILRKCSNMVVSSSTKTFRLNFYYLKNIRVLHSHYHPKIIVRKIIRDY